MEVEVWRAWYLGLGLTIPCLPRVVMEWEMVEGEVGAMISADGSVLRRTPVVEAGAPQAPRSVSYHE